MLLTPEIMADGFNFNPLNNVFASSEQNSNNQNLESFQEEPSVSLSSIEVPPELSSSQAYSRLPRIPMPSSLEERDELDGTEVAEQSNIRKIVSEEIMPKYYGR